MACDELKSLYPNLSVEALAEAAENLNRYLLLVWEILEKQQSTGADLEADEDQAYHPDKGRRQNIKPSKH